MSVNTIEQFHFIEPLWLLGLIPVIILISLIFKYQNAGNSAWKAVIDEKFLPYLLVRQGGENKRRLPLILLSIGWIVAVIALANPSWKSLPQPVFQQPDAQVIVLNLSSAMLDDDIKPSRLLQARYKIESILRQSQGKQTGLIAYAGDAFSVTPLTDDIATLKSQLRVLEPSLMPVNGNRPDRALLQAGQLLRQAGYQQGHIIVITAAAGNSSTLAKATDISHKLAQDGYQVSVLNVSRAATNKVASTELQEIARAGNGVYAAYSGNQQDIKSILAAAQGSAIPAKLRKAKDKQAQHQVAEGPWLAVLLLPLALLAFRRGWLLAFSFVMLGQLINPPAAMAFSWDDLWQRPDQQAAVAFSKKDYKRAENLAPDKMMQGSAQYRSGQYQQAVKSFSQKDDAQSAYNMGNALAHTGDYKKAIAAYDKALKQQPDMQDAIANRKLIAALLKQQQQKEKQKNKQQKKDKNKGKGKQKKDNKGDKGKDKKQGNKGKDKKQQGGQSSDKSDSKSANKSDNKAKQSDKKSAADKKDSAKQNSGKQNASKKSAAKKDSESAAKDNKSAKQSADKQKTAQSQQKNKSQKTDKSKENNFSRAGSKQQQKKADQAVKQAAEKKSDKHKAEKMNMAQASTGQDKLSPEERESVENWLRRVPDDPGGLLRRKFLYQYQQRQQR